MFMTFYLRFLDTVFLVISDTQDPVCSTKLLQSIKSHTNIIFSDLDGNLTIWSLYLCSYKSLNSIKTTIKKKYGIKLYKIILITDL